MFIFTTRFPRRRALLLALGVVLAVCAVTLLTVRAKGGDEGRAAAAGVSVSARNIRENADRVEFLEQYGWLVGETPLVTEEVLIPKELTDEYTNYVSLQESQGFDLTKYCGKRVKRYSYEILNYPTGETGVTVNLLIYKNTVIGADVCSPALDGFMHGLDYMQKR